MLSTPYIAPVSSPALLVRGRKRMIRPIQVRRAVDENKRVFWDLNHNVRAFNQFMTKRMPQKDENISY